MRIFIAVPCMDMVHTDFMESLLNLKTEHETKVGIKKSSLVYDSRNLLAQEAVEGGYDRILWLDSDMVFAPDLLDRLSADLDEGREFVCGLFFKRKPPYHPVLYSELGYTQEGNRLTPFSIPFMEPEEGTFEVQGTGFGAVMVSCDAVKAVYEKYGAPFTPQPGFGEDLSFCIRMAALGIKMYCDSSIKVGHIGNVIINDETVRNGVIA